ncbi:T9SS type A sorting domain-containing protein [bacterium]|nr:T9SS type A sorting domain-containing protein [bacterium]
MIMKHGWFLAVFSATLLVCIPISSLAGTAPDSLWVRYGGNRQGYSQGFDLEPLDDGCIIACGTFGYDTTETYDRDVWLVKFDPDGHLLWQQKYGDEQRQMGYGVESTPDGGFVIAASTQVLGNNSDIGVIKTDGDGNLQWATSLPSEHPDFGRDVSVTPEGDILVCGWTEIDPSRMKAVLAKLNPDDGSVIWQRTYDGGVKEQAWTLEVLQDGNYAFAGRTWSYGAGGRDAFICKVNPDGDFLGAITYGGEEKDHIYEFKETPDGGFICTGKTESFDLGEGDAWLLRYNQRGDMLWMTMWGGHRLEFGRSVCCTADGGYIMSGVTNVPGSGNQILLAKANDDGFWEWSTTLGGPEMEDSWGVCQTADGGFAVTGFTRSVAPQRFLVAKYGPDHEYNHSGNKPTGVDEDHLDCSIPGVDCSSLLETAYPNPFNAFTSIALNLQHPAQLNVDLVNLEGRVVRTLLNSSMSAGSFRIPVDAGDLASGTYFVRAQATGQPVAVQKLVLVR